MTTADDSAWWMFSYKVSPCPIQERHDWSTCPNAHRGERAARRCPRTYSYTPEPCPEYNKTGSCASGVNCPLAHSVFESWLHPSRFRTQLCCFGSSCKRRICFFAHDPGQLRAATQTPNSAAAAVAAAATGAPVMRRTQAVVPASMVTPAYPAAGAAASPAAAAGISSTRGGSPAVLGTSGAPSLHPSPQAQPLAGLPAQQWLYTSAGWVQAAPGMGQPMLIPMAGMQAPLQQAPVVPVDHTMFSGLAAGLSGLSLQDQADFSSSGQGLACMPAMGPTSPGQPLLYQQSGAAYAVPGIPPAAQQIMYAPAQGRNIAGMPQQGQQQWQ